MFGRGHMDRRAQLFFRRVRAAFFAARERSALLRWCAAERACRDNARCEAAERGSRLSAFFTARERVGDGLRRLEV